MNNTASHNHIKSEGSKEDRAFWKKHFALQQSTGLSKAAYCRKYGLNYDRARYHFPKLKMPMPKKLIPVALNSIEESGSLSRLYLGKDVYLDITSKEAFCFLLIT